MLFGKSAAETRQLVILSLECNRDDAIVLMQVFGRWYES